MGSQRCRYDLAHPFAGRRRRVGVFGPYGLCPNCGRHRAGIFGLCGCTWAEMLRAAREQERRAREEERAEERRRFEREVKDGG